MIKNNIMDAQQLNALPSLDEIAKNGITISDEIRAKIKEKSLSSDEVQEIIGELKGCIQMMESLKESLNEEGSL